VQLLLYACFFSLRHVIHFFAETFWSLRHFGELSYSSIKTYINNIHYSVFSDIVTELT